MSKEYPRHERFSHLISREVSTLLYQHASDPRFKEVTISHVNVTNDCRLATIFVQLPATHKNVLMALQKAVPFFKRELGHRVHLRYLPDLRFKEDLTISYTQEINQLIDKTFDEQT